MSRVDWRISTRPCVENGCDDPQAARGRCRRHYQAWYRQNRGERKREADRRWRERVDYNGQRRKPAEERACAECGDRFETAMPHKRFCSKRCKKRAENRRLRSGMGL